MRLLENAPSWHRAAYYAGMTVLSRREWLDPLFSAVEDLLKRIADTDDPYIRRVRAQVRSAMLEIQHILTRE